MHLVNVMPVRNEAWILGFSARAVLLWADALVVLNHASTDATADILADVQREHPNRVTVLHEPNSQWDEMNHRERLLNTARANGATHIATVDADEVLTGPLVPDVRSLIENCKGQNVMQLWMPCIWRSTEKYRCDASVWSRVWASTAFCNRPEFGWKPRGDYQFHHRHPFNSSPCYRPMPRDTTATSLGGLMHLQFVRWRALVAKQTHYKMTELLRWPGREPVAAVDQKYNQSMNEDGAAFHSVPDSWWQLYRDNGMMQHMDLTTTQPTWHEKECIRMLHEHGKAKFAGLTLPDWVSQ